MTYPCEIIKDLMPLVIDSAASEESKGAVTGHLAECPECKKYYEEMKSDNGFSASKNSGSEDIKMAESLKNIKNQIIKKRVLTSLLSAAAVILVIFGTVSALKHSKRDIVYDKNITVTESTNGEKELYAQFTGHTPLEVTQKRVEIPSGDKTEVRIYFYASTTKWEDILANGSTVSNYLLTKINAENDVDKIFYYVGDYENLENLGASGLSEIDNKSALIYSK